MTAIVFNQVLRIDGAGYEGLYRVVAILADRGEVQMAQFVDGPRIPGRRRTRLADAPLPALQQLEAQGLLRAIEIQPSRNRVLRPDQLSDAAQRIFEAREKLLPILLDPTRFRAVFTADYPEAVLVREIGRATEYSRAQSYRILDHLFEHGFTATALYPALHRCGAPGKIRPTDGRKRAGRKTIAQRIDPEREAGSVGITRQMGDRILAIYLSLPSPKPSYKDIRTQVLLKAFVSRYEETEDGPVPILDDKGTYPNERQITRIIKTRVTTMQRVLDRTTVGHFNRNLRPLHGMAWDGVLGPGHCYAIDSTIGDIHLRSSINRAWPVGRPIVYIVVDVWSTAVVGFYVSLPGPSWRTAKLALFSSCSEPALIGDLWGYVPVMALHPAPTLPAVFRCDRGEYLSKAAAQTMQGLGVHMTYNPAYRPDLKGTVEVFHRIVKDYQFHFAPGAIDRRRKELELQADPRRGVFVLREYVQYLYYVFQHFNLHRNLRHRLTAEMIADGVPPTPAGLWRWGHAVGLGYSKAHSFDELGIALLDPMPGRVTPKGVFMGAMQYESDIIDSRQWTGIARAEGGWGIELLQYPGTLSRVWWADQSAGGLRQFKASPEALAPANASLDEWLDAQIYSLMRQPDLDHARAQAEIALLHRQKQLRSQAVILTREAEELERGNRAPPIRVARSIEADLGLLSSSSEQSPGSAAIDTTLFSDNDRDEQYLKLMKEHLDA